jgi:hypothetical protein
VLSIAAVVALALPTALAAVPVPLGADRELKKKRAAHPAACIS